MDRTMPLRRESVDEAECSWGREQRELPRQFVDRVHDALEHTMERQGYDCCEREHRRDQTDRWLNHLREGTRFNDWYDRMLRPAELTPEQAKENAEAHQRAEVLLRSVLSPNQLKELEKRDYFHVLVGKRRFRITRGRQHTIKEVDSRSRILRTLCAHPIEHVPDADTMLAQKLLLETRARDFFKIANVMAVRRPRRRAGSPEESAAMVETQRAEETMAVLEQAALDVTAGVDGVPPTQNVRAA